MNKPTGNLVRYALIFILAAAAGSLFFLNRSIDTKGTLPEVLQSAPCIPTFVDGGGPYYQPNTPFRENIGHPAANGPRLEVTGKVLANDCKTILKDAIVDIWHASPGGKYDDTWYRGRVRTNGKGQYRFVTYLPKGYGEGTAYRPPHIHFKIWVNGKEVITSQMFFPDARGKAGFNDAYIMKVTKKGDNTYATHDIILP